MNNPITLMERVAALEARVTELEHKLGAPQYQYIPPVIPAPTNGGQPSVDWPIKLPTPVEFSEPHVTVTMESVPFGVPR